MRISRILIASALLAAAELPAITLVRDGQAAAVIVLPDHDNYIAERAAAELNHHLKAASGVALPVLKQSEAENATDPRLCLGILPSGVDMPEFSDYNEARLYSRDGDLYIFGNDEPEGDPGGERAGTVRAVYELMRREWGIRWLWPGPSGEVIPCRASVELPDGDRTILPAQVLAVWRGIPNHDGWQSEEARDYFFEQQERWLQRNLFHQNLAMQHYPHAGTAEWTRFMRPEFHNLLPDGVRGGDKLYFYARPDLTGTCVSNPELHREIVRDFLENGDPKIPLINLNENDTAGKCVCDACMAWDESPIPTEVRRARATERFLANDPGWYQELGDLSLRYGKFYRAVLDEADRQAPGRDLGAATLAYANYANAPAGLQFDGRSYLRYCPPMMFPWTDEKTEHFIRNWDDWVATGTRMILRPNYTWDGHCYPIFYAHKVGRAMEHFNRDGDRYVGMDLDSLKGDFGAEALNYYMIARMSQDRGATVDSVFDEFYSAFGPAEPAIRAYFNRLRELSDGYQALSDRIEGGDWMGFFRVAANLFSPEVFEELQASLDEAARLAAGHPEYAGRVEFLQLGLTHARLAAETERAYRQFEESGRSEVFYEAYDRLREFRAAHETSLTFNVGPLTLFESSEWPRARRNDDLPQGMEPLPDRWQFRFDPQEEGFSLGWHQPGFDDSQWDSISVSNFWENQPAGREFEKEHGRKFDGHAWYRSDFEVPEFDGRRVVLYFGAVDDGCDLYVNGTKVLERRFDANLNPDSWQQPFEVDVTGEVQPGVNQVTAMVSDQGGLGGIWRGVYCQVAAPEVNDGNLVKNFSFEKGLREWNTHVAFGNVSCGIDKEQAADGNWSARMTVKGIDRKQRFGEYGAWARFYQNLAGLTPGRECQLRFSLMTSEDFEGQAVIWVITGDQTASRYEPPTGGQWREVAFSFVPDAAEGVLYCNAVGNRGIIHFDAVGIRPAE